MTALQIAVTRDLEACVHDLRRMMECPHRKFVKMLTGYRCIKCGYVSRWSSDEGREASKEIMRSGRIVSFDH